MGQGFFLDGEESVKSDDKLLGSISAKKNWINTSVVEDRNVSQDNLVSWIKIIKKARVGHTHWFFITCAANLVHRYPAHHSYPRWSPSGNSDGWVWHVIPLPPSTIIISVLVTEGETPSQALYVLRRAPWQVVFTVVWWCQHFECQIVPGPSRDSSTKQTQWWQQIQS